MSNNKNPENFLFPFFCCGFRLDVDMIYMTLYITVKINCTEDHLDIIKTLFSFWR